MAYAWTEAVPSMQQFFARLRAIRICPSRIEDTEDGRALKMLTLAIAVIIFALARSLIAGGPTDPGPYLIAIIISAVIVFIAGYGALIVQPGEPGQLLARQWAAFFVYIWLTSLVLLILIDGLPFALNAARLSSWPIDIVVPPGGLEEWQKDLARSVLFTLAALLLLLVQTRRADPNFSLSSPCWIVAAAIGLVVNALLMLAFVYGNLI